MLSKTREFSERTKTHSIYTATITKHMTMITVPMPPKHASRRFVHLNTYPSYTIPHPPLLQWFIPVKPNWDYDILQEPYIHTCGPGNTLHSKDTTFAFLRVEHRHWTLFILFSLPFSPRRFVCSRQPMVYCSLFFSTFCTWSQAFLFFSFLSLSKANFYGLEVLIFIFFNPGLLFPVWCLLLLFLYLSGWRVCPEGPKERDAISFLRMW